jgi:hypothetical protein
MSGADLLRVRLRRISVWLFNFIKHKTQGEKMKHYKNTMISRALKGGLTFYVLLSLTMVGAISGNAATSGNKTKRTVAKSAQTKEIDAILSAAAKQAKTSKDAFQKNLVANRFTPEQNVFLPSALAVDFKKQVPTVTLPLYKGIGPSGQPTYFIITEAADFDVAKRFGINYSPKLIYGKDTEGIQKVTLQNGVMKFAGDVDFKPERILEAGDSVIPPVRFEPGAIADDKYSPLIQLPSGTILNTPIVANASGTHDHLVNIDYEKGTVEFELLDGFQGGQQYYYHLVTDSNDKLASTIERGTFTPRLGKLPAFGKDRLGDKSTLLGFAPTANGEIGKDNPERQGLNSTILDGNAYDPINVFPIDPDNNKRDDNNYSPMWDAHIYVWTDAAIKAGKRKRIKSFEELAQRFKDGDIADAGINKGEPNSFVAGLKPSNAIINCPVIAQPVRR